MVDINKLIKEGKTEEEILDLLYVEAKTKYAEAAAQSKKDQELEDKIQATATALKDLLTFVNPNLQISGLDTWARGIAQKTQRYDGFAKEWFSRDLSDLFCYWL